MSGGKNILVGVTGGIAAYKSADLVSRLKKRGYEVRCMMTEGAQQFLTPLTLQTLSGNPVITELFAEPKFWNVEHISVAQWADYVIIAPTTANVVGKIANGIADDFLTTTVMATEAKVIMATAMNVNMYKNPIFQQNVEKLKFLGYHFIEPVEGNLACGDTGKGKMAEPSAIVKYLEQFDRKDLVGTKILVTAGPTREAIDPVRFVTNRSTGKMGYSIAKRAQERGADVTLISGPTNLEPPQGVSFIPVQSALDMFEAVQQNLEENDVIIKSAAVADYRPKQYMEQKVKKQEGDWNLILERNPDILAYIGANKGNKITVGFAAETNNLYEHAMRKLEKKNLDFIVANDVSKPGAGFGSDTNQVVILDRFGIREELPMMSKLSVADGILDKIKTIREKELF